MDLSTVALLFASIFFWGIWGIFHKIGVSKLGAETSLLVNYFSASISALTILSLTRKLQINKGVGLIYPLVAGASVTLGTFAFLITLEKTSVSIARSLAGLSVLVTVILGVVFLGENLNFKQYIGIGFAILAIILLSR